MKDVGAQRSALLQCFAERLEERSECEAFTGEEVLEDLIRLLGHPRTDLLHEVPSVWLGCLAAVEGT